MFLKKNPTIDSIIGRTLALYAGDAPRVAATRDVAAALALDVSAATTTTVVLANAPLKLREFK